MQDHMHRQFALTTVDDDTYDHYETPDERRHTALLTTRTLRQPDAYATPARVRRATSPDGAEERTATRPRPLPPSRLRHGLIASDAVAILIGVGLASIALVLIRDDASHLTVEHTLLGWATLPAWIAAIAVNRLFTARTLDRPLDEVRRLLVSSLAGAGSIVAFAFVIGYSELSRLWVGLVFVVTSASLVTSRTIARHTFAWLRRSGYCTRPVVVVGTGADALSLVDTVRSNPRLGYDVVGLVGEEADVPDGTVRFLGTTDAAVEVIDGTPAIGVILSIQSLAPETVNTLTRQLTRSGYHVTLSSALRDIDITRARPQAIDGQMLLYIEPAGTSAWGRVGKAVFDVVVAALALVLAAPVLAIAALAIKLGSPGPVIFSQERVGRDGQPFRLYKLRTMSVDAEALRDRLIAENGGDSRLFKLDNDPRVTRVGRILRKTSIDELPQFWNVLKREMSIVGPRPALPDEVAHWTPDVFERLQVLPGITGMWQVYGRSDADFERYKRLDLYYVDNWSLLRDMVIVGRTFQVVLFGRGAR